jgi:hypothetical protein
MAWLKLTDVSEEHITSIFKVEKVTQINIQQEAGSKALQCLLCPFALIRTLKLFCYE